MTDMETKVQAADCADNADDVKDATAPTEGVADGLAAEKTVAADKRVKAPRKRLIGSIPRRTTVNYILYSVILLVVLWSIFLLGMNWYYDTVVTSDMLGAHRAAASAFPRRGDDNSMTMFYRLRLTEIARSNSCAIVVFKREDGVTDIQTMTDGMGNSIIGGDSELFDAVVSRLDFDNVFGSGRDIATVGTSMGKFICAGSTHTVETADGDMTLYMLLLKPYSAVNSLTVKIIYVLIGSTLILLVFACLFAYIASRYQTNKLTDFSQKAKRLAQGDYEVRFSGDGYNEYESLASALNDATDKLQRAENLQREIVANVSHDIRTPLTMIRAYAEMLRDMPFDEKKRKATADVIISEADRLTVLSRDVLDYSRLQSGVTEFKFEPNDISAIAVQVLQRFDLYRERDGIQFDVDIDKNVVVNCDKTHIEQLLYNLLNNAYNYCGEDKVIILSLKKTNGKVRVEVTDHGNGIDKAELDTVWDRYYRTAHAQRSAAGSGLGLSICKNILLAHGAQFGVISDVGQGATFWFELEVVKSK